MQEIIVSSPAEGIQKAKELLYHKVTPDSALFLSGGSTPKPLYEQLAHERKLYPRAVGMIDERYGKPMHENSNEKMIADSGFLPYLYSIHCPVYHMLKEDTPMKELLAAYDKRLIALVMNIPHKLAIMGIGTDGHIAGIAPNRDDFHNPIFDEKDITLVNSFTDEKGSFGTRITLTFDGLSLMDEFIILAFGENKKEALRKMKEQGTEQEVPARFFLRENIESKAILITDQKM